MNSSYRVVELVRAKISNEYVTASDTDIARVLSVSRAAVSSYKHEKNVMSVETLAKAQEVLELPQQDYFDLMLALTAEGTHDPSLQDTWVRLHRFVRSAIKHSGSRAAAWLMAVMVAAGMNLASPGNQAIASSFDAEKICIIRSYSNPFR